MGRRDDAGATPRQKVDTDTSESSSERETYRKNPAVVVLMERGYCDLHTDTKSQMEVLIKLKRPYDETRS